MSCLFLNSLSSHWSYYLPPTFLLSVSFHWFSWTMSFSSFSSECELLKDPRILHVFLQCPKPNSLFGVGLQCFHTHILLFIVGWWISNTVVKLSLWFDCDQNFYIHRNLGRQMAVSQSHPKQGPIWANMSTHSSCLLWKHLQQIEKKLCK